MGERGLNLTLPVKFHILNITLTLNIDIIGTYLLKVWLNVAKHVGPIEINKRYLKGNSVRMEFNET
jgi:hypothetical protein